MNGLADPGQRPMIVALGAGIVIGVLLGLLGGGGSILAVPALVYAAGQPLSAAVPTSLIVVGLSSAAAVIPRLRQRGQVSWRIAGVVGLAGTATAFAGTAVNRMLPADLVLLGFAALMVGAAVQMLRGRAPAGGACVLPGGGVNWRSCLPKAILTGAVVGFLTGLFGVGGGFLLIPALTLLLGLPMTTAIGTSLVIIVINSLAGLSAHTLTGGLDLDPGITIAFSATAIIASLLAARVASRLPGEKLRRWFGYLVLAAAALIIIETAIRPR